MVKKATKKQENRIANIKDTKKFRYKIQKVSSMDNNIQYDLLTIYNVKDKTVSRKLLSPGDYKKLFPNEIIAKIKEEQKLSKKDKQGKKVNIIDEKPNSNAQPTQNIVIEKETFFSSFARGLGLGAGAAIGSACVNSLIESFNYVGNDYDVDDIENDYEEENSGNYEDEEENEYEDENANENNYEYEDNSGDWGMGDWGWGEEGGSKKSNYKKRK